MGFWEHMSVNGVIMGWVGKGARRISTPPKVMQEDADTAFLIRAEAPCFMLFKGANMTFHRLFIMSVLIVVSSLLVIKTASGHFADEAPNLSSLSDADLKAVTVRLERFACFGTCPVYTVTIHGDGRVEYNGKSSVKQKGTRDGRIETDTIRTLISEFAKAKFWALPEEYSEAQCTGRVCTDMATAVTELTVRGVTRRVEHYYGCGSAPKVLFDLEAAIDRSANVEQWTGDVSKAGPVGTSCSNRN